MNPRMKFLAALSAFALLIAACGDDDDEQVVDDTEDTSIDDVSGDEGDDGDGDGDDAAGDEIAAENVAYCDAITEIDESEEGPSPEMIAAAVDAAPDEIAEEAQTIGAKFEASGGDFGALIADSEFVEAINTAEQFEAENCGPDQAEPDLIEAAGDTDAADGAEVVAVSAVDYGFEGVPGEIAAGSVAIEVTNEGDAGHEAFVGKLADGTTLDDVLAFEGDPFEAGLVTEDVGGVFIPSPGDTRVINAELEPGTYGIVCFIPGPEGTPHAFLGMASEFTVTG